jgi:hypothetical protein
MAPIAITPDHTSPSGSENGFYTGNGRPNGLANGVNGAFLNGHANGVNGSGGRPLDGLTSRNTASINKGGIMLLDLNRQPDPAATITSAGGPVGSPNMPVAIVGMACRFPGGVSSPVEFWELLSRNRTGFTEIPKDRFETGAFHHPNAGKGGSFTPAGGNFLDCDFAAFDAPFFGLTEKEAISMDPQQRLLLECTFEALENAGIPKSHIVGKDVGVFIGGSFPEYESHLFRDSDTIPMHQATGKPTPSLARESC